MSKFFRIDSDTESESSDDNVYEEKLEHKELFCSENDPAVKRIVKSSVQKWQEEMNAAVLLVRNFMKIKDYNNLNEAVNNLFRLYGKCPVGLVPNFYYKCIEDVEDFVTSNWEARVSLTKIGAKSLSALKQNIRKYKMKHVHVYSETAEEIEVVDSVEVVLHENIEMNEGSGSTDSDSDLSSIDYQEGVDKIRDYFLKKSDHCAETAHRKKKTKRALRISEEWQTVKKGLTAQPTNTMIPLIDGQVKLEDVIKRLDEVLLMKTTKKTGRLFQINVLGSLKGLAEKNNLNSAVRVKIGLVLVEALLDYNLNFTTSMKDELWQQILNLMKDVTNNLLDDELSICFDYEVEELTNAPFKVRGCLVATLERLSDQYERIMKDCNPFGMEYLDRFKDESVLNNLVDKVLAYCEKNESKSMLCRIYLCKLNLLHYKFNKQLESETYNTVDKLSKFIYRNDTTNVLRTRAILFHIYFLANHDYWLQARDLMLMSHLQENIEHSDTRTKIYYNRAMAQLGLCAFRHGYFLVAHDCLTDLINTGRPKELLGQGFILSKTNERSHEQEQRERQQHLPFHMHISLQLLECCNLICALLIDIPYLVSQTSRRRVISKALYLQLRINERQNLHLPPESMREHVISAGKSLRTGDWRTSLDIIFSEKMNSMVWKLIQQSTTVNARIRDAFKKCALHSYLLHYGFIFDRIFVSQLSQMFELSNDNIRGFLAKMIDENELQVSLDATTDSVLILNQKLSCLQRAALLCADKLGFLMDVSERLANLKSNEAANFHKPKRFLLRV